MQLISLNLPFDLSSLYISDDHDVGQIRVRIDFSSEAYHCRMC